MRMTVETRSRSTRSTERWSATARVSWRSKRNAGSRGDEGRTATSTSLPGTACPVAVDPKRYAAKRSGRASWRVARIKASSGRFTVSRLEAENSRPHADGLRRTRDRIHDRRDPCGFPFRGPRARYRPCGLPKRGKPVWWDGFREILVGRKTPFLSYRFVLGKTFLILHPFCTRNLFKYNPSLDSFREIRSHPSASVLHGNATGGGGPSPAGTPRRAGRRERCCASKEGKDRKNGSGHTLDVPGSMERLFAGDGLAGHLAEDTVDAALDLDDILVDD